MMMKMTNLLIALLLILTAAGCAPADVSEQVQAAVTAVEASQLTVVNNTPLDAPGQTDPTGTPVETAEPPGDAGTPLDAPGQTDPTATPVETAVLSIEGAEGEIYAAAIRQVYNVDHSFGSPPGFPLVFISTTTDDGALLDAPWAAEQELRPELLQAVEAELADQPFEIIWVKSLDDVPMDESKARIADGQGIYITLGNILPQDDGTVQLPFFMYCGALCALGKIYVLTAVDGVWLVTGSVGMEIMS